MTCTKQGPQLQLAAALLPRRCRPTRAAKTDIRCALEIVSFKTPRTTRALNTQRLHLRHTTTIPRTLTALGRKPAKTANLVSRGPESKFLPLRVIPMQTMNQHMTVLAHRHQITKPLRHEPLITPMMHMKARNTGSAAAVAGVILEGRPELFTLHPPSRGMDVPGVRSRGAQDGTSSKECGPRSTGPKLLGR